MVVTQATSEKNQQYAHIQNHLSRNKTFMMLSDNELG